MKRPLKSGLFITFEGPDGSGKTTASQAVLKALVDAEYDVIYTREPGGIEIAEAIRHIILDPKNTAMDIKTEALLYAASRRQHYVEKVAPALRAQRIVLCDRFIDSSLAYQGYARGLGIDTVLAINEFAIEGHYPDLTLYFDVSAELGLSRIADRSYLDRLDQEHSSFHTRVVEGYRDVLKRFPERIVSIDASRAPQHVSEDALERVLAKVHDYES